MYKGPGLQQASKEERRRRRQASSHLNVLSKIAHSGPSACDSERETTAHSLHLILDRIMWGAAELQSAGSSLGIDMLHRLSDSLLISSGDSIALKLL